MNILQINSSARVAGSHSTNLANQVSARLRSQHSGADFVLRDLAVTPQPSLDEAALQALDDALIAEAQAADILVIGAPMYNFGISSQLKNWIDAISRAQVTFRYTANGPEGLLKNKKVYVVLTRGGLYRNTPNDTQMPYLKNFFAFLGMTDVEFIYAEGLAMGPEGEQRAISDAQAQIEAALA